MNHSTSPLARFYQPDNAFTTVATTDERQSCARLDNLIHAAQGSVLAEEAGILIQNDRPVLGSAWMLNVLKGRGYLDRGLAQLEEKVTHKDWALVLVHGESYPPELLATINSSYHQVASIQCVFNWQVFLP